MRGTIDMWTEEGGDKKERPEKEKDVEERKRDGRKGIYIRDLEEGEENKRPVLSQDKETRD